MRPASGFTPDERLYLVEQPHLVKAQPQEIKLRATGYTGGFRSSRGASIFPLWATLAICVALVAVAFICSQRGVKGFEPGAAKRHLAGGDEDPFDSLPSPELEQLCTSLGPWIPEESSPGNPRQSPYRVEEFFAEIERDEGSGAALVPEGPATTEALTCAAIPGPTAQSAGGADDAMPGPSWRLPTQGLLRTPQNAPSPPASQEPPIRPSHPFLHLPALQQGVTPRPWWPTASPFSIINPASSQQLLGHIRELLLLPSLDAGAAEELMTAAEQLGAYVLGRLSAATPPTRPFDAVEKYGRRFLCLDAIHSAAQAIGLPHPLWWQGMVEATLKDCQCDSAASQLKRPSYTGFLARDLAVALLKYKNGGFPTPEEVLDLKRRLLCNPKTIPYFRHSHWDSWREDDKQD